MHKVSCIVRSKGQLNVQAYIGAGIWLLRRAAFVSVSTSTFSFSPSSDILGVGLVIDGRDLALILVPEATRRAAGVDPACTLENVDLVSVDTRAGGVGELGRDTRGFSPLDPSVSFIADPVADALLEALIRLLLPSVETLTPSPLALPESETTEVAREGGREMVGVLSKAEAEPRRWMTLEVEAEEAGGPLEPALTATLRLYWTQMLKGGWGKK